jgi:predicted regulator of Ras-like GTPase activity (Roadblock/LC7/MglB family)
MTSHSDSDTVAVAPGGPWNAPPPASVAPFAPPSVGLLASAPVGQLAPPRAPGAELSVPTTAAEALDEMTGVFGGARGALLASVDGFALAQSDTMPNEASHAAMLAAAVGLAHQLVVMGGGEQLRQLVVDHDNGSLLLWPIGNARVLAVLADTNVDQVGLRRFVRSRVALLAGTS